MSTLRNIAVGVDFSPFSRSALLQAARIAQRDGAKLHVIHVIEAIVLEDLEKAFPRNKEVRLDVLAATRHRLEDFVKPSLPDGIDANVRVAVGDPLTEVLRHVHDTAADLLILGSNGWSDPRGGPGALAVNCIRQAPCMVLLVRASHTSPFRRVVACVDFSATSKRAVEEAVRTARRDHARLDILHVFTPPWAALHYRAPTPQASPDYEQEYRQLLNGTLTDFLGELASDLDELAAERHIVESTRPAPGIVDYLRTSGADLAVVGTRGRSRIALMLMGTTAERVVRESPCSVLLAKPSTQ